MPTCKRVNNYTCIIVFKPSRRLWFKPWLYLDWIWVLSAAKQQQAAVLPLIMANYLSFSPSVISWKSQNHRYNYIYGPNTTTTQSSVHKKPNYSSMYWDFYLATFDDRPITHSWFNMGWYVQEILYTSAWYVCMYLMYIMYWDFYVATLSGTMHSCSTCKSEELQLRRGSNAYWSVEEAIHMCSCLHILLLL